MSFEVDLGIASDAGPRASNEDFAQAARAPKGDESRGVIAAIADGVSHGGRGREAAQTSVLAVLDGFFAAPATWEPTVTLDRLVGAQNAWLADHNRRRQATTDAAGASGGAGLTTLTVLALQGQTWTLAHVGDTRAWRLRARGAERERERDREGAAADDGDVDARDTGDLRLLTADHVLDHPDLQSRLTRALGLDTQVHVDYTQGEARVGDVFVLTSDGVHRVLGPVRIAALLQERLADPACGAREAAQSLVAAALDRGGRDNATAVVLRVLRLDRRQLMDETADARRLDPPATLLKVGDVLDGYAITSVVIGSAPHLLYQARDARGGALVALKTLHPNSAADPEERAMLAHEAWLGLRVAERDARGFVRVHERRADASALYTVFDWHAGRTLEQMLAERRPAAVAQVVAGATEIAAALGRLHRLGVIHRDVKPANLHLGDDGQWRLLDLGVALSGRASVAQRELHAGTPAYVNPEQWDGAEADAASDLFALGVTLYRWLTGRLPYGEIEPYQTGRYRRDPQPPSRVRTDVPMWLDHLVLKAVARDPRRRFETAEELGLALGRGAARPVDAPPPTPLMRRDTRSLLQAALVVSLLLNALLIVWLLFLPR
jgi:serine/threonine protein phosphatase PrpC